MNQSPLFKLPASNGVLLTGDVHKGAAEHDDKRWSETLKHAREERLALVLMGDMIENSIVDGRAPGEKLLGQVMWPTEQVKGMIADLEWFAKQGLIVGGIRGNHCARTRRESLLDLMDLICSALRIPYFGVGSYVRFQARMQVYTCAFQHGRSGGKNYWTELDRYLSLYPEAELVAAGHVHVLDHRRVNHIAVDKAGHEIVRTRHQVRTGTMLGYSDYARESGFPPSTIGHPIVRFSPTAHTIDVDIKTLAWT